MDHKLNLKKQLACIYTSDLFSGLRITDAVWVALLAARGFSLWEIGLAESVYHIVSLFCEVPSGMAADLLGRRKTLLSGGVLTVTCNLLMAFAPNLFTICLAMGLNALAMTMFSGTFTALVYDSLKTEGREDEYIQVSANSSQISMLANAIGSLASLLKRFLGFALLPAERCVRGRFHRRPCADGGAHRHQGTGQPGKADPPHSARTVPPAGAGQPTCPAHLPNGRKAYRIQRPHQRAQLPDQDVFAAAAR